MSLFITIASIQLEHDYYTTPRGGLFGLVPTPKSRMLMIQRGIILKQIDFNKWQWLVDEENAESIKENVLEISLMVNDPGFLQKIAIKNYNPQKLYQIRLEKGDIVINNEFSLSSVSNEMKSQREFCRIILNLKQNHTIRFCSCSYYWEFLFIIRNGTDLCGKQLVLETTPKNAITFSPCKEYEDNRFGNNIYHIISMEKIEIRECYEFSLILYHSSSDGGGRKVVGRFIPIPEPGKFFTDRSDVLREVCYL